MLFDSLDPSSPTPLYLQIVETIRGQVVSGTLQAGARVPPVRELASTARVNRNTAARAIRQLEAEGLVRTRVGQGTFVQADVAVLERIRAEVLDKLLDGLVSEAEALGVTPEELTELFLDKVKAQTRLEAK